MIDAEAWARFEAPLPEGFEESLDRYQATLAEEAAEAAGRSYEAAARPDAVPLEVTFSDLRVGDYMTSDGHRWVKVVDLRGPLCYVKSRQESAADGVSVLFEIPEAVTVSGETRYWLDEPTETVVLVDASVR